MNPERSAWRANDVVAYDAFREVGNTAIALVLRLARDGVITTDAALSEAADIQRELLEVDAYDRAALDAAHRELDKRVRGLRERLA